MKNYLPIAVTLDYAKENGVSEEELQEFVQVSIELKKLIEAGKEVFSDFMEQKPVVIKSNSSQSAFLIKKGLILPYKKNKFLLTNKGLWYAKILFRGEQTEDCPDSPWTHYEYKYSFEEGKQVRRLVKNETIPNERGLHPFLNRAFDCSVSCNDCQNFTLKKMKASNARWEIGEIAKDDSNCVQFNYSCFHNLTHMEEDYKEIIKRGKPAVITVGCSGFKKK